MNIPELRLKVKEGLETLQNKEIYTAFLILVVGLCSFGLGRLSLFEGQKAPIIISNAIPFDSVQTASALSSSPSSPRGENEVARQGSSELLLPSSSLKEEEAKPAPGGQLVASKGGTKYYFPWCGSASRISEANKVWFNSVEEARKAGYTPAANCKGLK